jgi:hypothetical protein
MGLIEGKLYKVKPTDEASDYVWFKGVKNAESGVVEPKPLDAVDREGVAVYSRNYVLSAGNPIENTSYIKINPGSGTFIKNGNAIDVDTTKNTFSATGICFQAKNMKATEKVAFYCTLSGTNNVRVQLRNSDLKEYTSTTTTAALSENAQLYGTKQISATHLSDLQITNKAYGTLFNNLATFKVVMPKITNGAYVSFTIAPEDILAS